MVKAVQNDAHAFPGGNESGDADEPGGEGDDAPGATGGAEDEEEVDQEAGEDEEDAEAACKGDAGWIAVADGPADEVGMRLPAEGVFDRGGGGAEGGRVGGVLKSVQDCLALAAGDVEFAWATFGDVGADDAADFDTEGLCSDYKSQRKDPLENGGGMYTYMASTSIQRRQTPRRPRTGMWCRFASSCPHCST